MGGVGCLSPRSAQSPAVQPNTAHSSLGKGVHGNPEKVEEEHSAQSQNQGSLSSSDLQHALCHPQAASGYGSGCSLAEKLHRWHSRAFAEQRCLCEGLGCSLGGMISHRLTQRRPGRVTR